MHRTLVKCHAALIINNKTKGIIHDFMNNKKRNDSRPHEQQNKKRIIYDPMNNKKEIIHDLINSKKMNHAQPHKQQKINYSRPHATTFPNKQNKSHCYDSLRRRLRKRKGNEGQNADDSSSPSRLGPRDPARPPAHDPQPPTPSSRPPPSHPRLDKKDLWARILTRN